MPDPLTSIALVDAFASAHFTGNPAAVCILPSNMPPRSASWMQSLALELNQPATAFLQPRPTGDGFDLRWFTAKHELELCGHATLAATHVLFENGMLKPHQPATFHTRAGQLTAQDDGSWIELNFPGKIAEPVEIPGSLQVAIGENEVFFIGQNRLDLLVELASEEAVRDLQPNLDRLASIDVRGVIVTAKGSGEYDFVSRCFFPRMGIAEDHVTGSAHCALAPYWSAKLGKADLLAYQASSRGGVLRLSVEGDRVKISGQALTLWHGCLSGTF